MPKPQIVDISLQFIRETDKAIFVTEADEKDGVWLPKSQIVYEFKNGLVDVSMPRWLASEKKFIGY